MSPCAIAFRSTVEATAAQAAPTLRVRRAAPATGGCTRAGGLGRWQQATVSSTSPGTRARDRWRLRPRPGAGPWARRARRDRDRAGPQRGRARARPSPRSGAPHRYIVGDLTTDALYERARRDPRTRRHRRQQRRRRSALEAVGAADDAGMARHLRDQRRSRPSGCAQLFIPKMAAQGVGTHHQHLVDLRLDRAEPATTPGGTPAPAPTPRPSTASSA